MPQALRQEAPQPGVLWQVGQSQSCTSAADQSWVYQDWRAAGWVHVDWWCSGSAGSGRHELPFVPYCFSIVAGAQMCLCERHVCGLVRAQPCEGAKPCFMCMVPG
jgi:hypothetical protein